MLKETLREEIPIIPDGREKKSKNVVVPLGDLLDILGDRKEPSARELRRTYELIQALKKITGKKTDEDIEKEIEEIVEERVEEEIEKRIEERIEEEREKWRDRLDPERYLEVEIDDSHKDVKEKYIKKRCEAWYDKKTWNEIAELLGMASNSLVRWRRKLFDEGHPAHPRVPEEQSNNTFEDNRKQSKERYHEDEE